MSTFYLTSLREVIHAATSLISDPKPKLVRDVCWGRINSRNARGAGNKSKRRAATLAK